MRDSSAPLHGKARQLTDLTVRELAMLRLLNEELERAGHWVRARGARSLYVYRKTLESVPRAPAYVGGNPSEPGITLTGTVLCMRRATHPAFVIGADNVVAQISCSGLLDLDSTTGDDIRRTTRNTDGRNQESLALLGLNQCWLFTALVALLEDDWAQILSIGEVHVDVVVAVTATARREFTVAMPAQRTVPSS